MQTRGEGFRKRLVSGQVSRSFVAAVVVLAAALVGCDDETPITPRDAAVDRPVDRAVDRGSMGEAGPVDSQPADRAGDAGGGVDGGNADRVMNDVAPTDGAALPDVAPDAGSSDVPAMPDLPPADVGACATTCRADQVGTYCANGKAVATCRAEGACFVSSGTTTCPGVKTCAGASGAAACVCPAAGSTLGTGCGAEGSKVCSGNAVVSCVADAGGSGCLVWATTEDCAASAGCVVSGGVAACGGCGMPTTEISVDPVAGNDTGAGEMTPTGAANPPACRFKTLARAITAATPGKLRVVVRGATKPVRFEAEPLPVVVPAGVRLSSEDPTLDPASVRLVARAAGEAIVTLGDGATVEGFTLEAAIGTVNAAVAIAGGTGTAKSVRIETSGTGRVGRAIAIGNDTPAAASAVVTGATIVRADVGIFVGSTSGTSTATDVVIEDAATGLELTAGTLNATNLAIRKAAAAGFGVKLGGTASAVRLAATNLTIKDLSRTGIEVVRGAGAPPPQLSLTGGEISGLAESGIAAEGAVSTIDGTNIHHNAAWGLEVAGVGSTTTLGRGTKVDSNRFGGISVRTGASLTGTGISASRNLVGQGGLVDGVRIEGGTVVLHDVVLDENEGRAFAINGGSVTVDQGSVLRGNGRTAGSSAIRHQAGTMVLGGATGGIVEVSGSGRHGIYVWTDSGTQDGSVTIQRTKLTGHLANGLFVDVVPGTAATPVTVSDTEISGNDANGVRVDRAEPVGGVGLRLLRVNVVGNGKGANDGVGLIVNGTDDVDLSVESCNIKDNRSSGVIVRQEPGATVVTEFIGNDVGGNNLREDAEVGGVHFATASTLDGFRGNQMHGNVGPEVGFSAGPNGGGTWTLGSGACDAGANKIYCYGTGGVGVRLLGAGPVNVNAAGTTWQNATPQINVDWSAAGAGTVTTSGACGAAAATCP
jgi:hypothetical protein